MSKKIYRANVTVGVDVKVLEYADSLVESGFFSSRSQVFESFGYAYMEANNGKSEDVPGVHSGNGRDASGSHDNSSYLPGMRVRDQKGA